MENKEHPAVSPDVHPPLRQAAKFHGRTELCFWMSSSVRGWESKPRYLRLSESSFPSEPTHRVAWRSHRGRGDHDPPGEAVQHLSHSASGEAKWITKLPTEKIAHFCHSYKRKKKKGYKHKRSQNTGGSWYSSDTSFPFPPCPSQSGETRFSQLPCGTF